MVHKQSLRATCDTNQAQVVVKDSVCTVAIANEIGHAARFCTNKTMARVEAVWRA